MALISDLLVCLVALLQFYFMVVEMFLWKTPRVMRAFGLSREFAEQSETLAKNQGLYNGFLSAGLVWGLLVTDPAVGFEFRRYFLLCVLVAGIYGAITANKRIIFIQATPAFIALVCLLLSR